MTTRVFYGLLLGLLVAASALAVRTSLRAVRADERQRVLAEGAAMLDAQLAAERRAWSRVRDSLEGLVAQRDTVVRERLRIVRQDRWLPADTTPAVRLAACVVELDRLATACEAYRTEAAATMAAQRAVIRSDSLTREALTARAVAVRDSLAQALRERDRRPTWRAVGLAAGLSALAVLVTR